MKIVKRIFGFILLYGIIFITLLIAIALITFIATGQLNPFYCTQLFSNILVVYPGCSSLQALSQLMLFRALLAVPLALTVVCYLLAFFIEESKEDDCR